MAETTVSVGTLTQRVQSTANGVGGIVPEHQLVPIDSSGNVNSELPLGTMPALATTIDFPMVSCAFMRPKTLYLVVTPGFTWVTSGNVTAQLYVGRVTANAVDSNHPLVGVATNLLTASGTSLAAGTYVLTANGIYTGNSFISVSTNFAELANFHPFVGLRLVFPSTPSAGSATAYVEASAN